MRGAIDHHVFAPRPANRQIVLLNAMGRLQNAESRALQGLAM
jgi:hypothetical protein